jgi:hypothetical protein
MYQTFHQAVYLELNNRSDPTAAANLLLIAHLAKIPKRQFCL